VWAGDLDGLISFIEGLDDRDAAARWYSRNRHKIKRECGWYGSIRARADGESETADWLEAVLAAAFADAAEAASSMPWRRYWAMRGPWLPELLRIMKSRGRSWNAEFAETVSALPLARQQLLRSARAIFGLVVELVDTYDLEVPYGAAFVRGWMDGFPPEPSVDDLVAGMTADPLMPGIHARLLASGEVGRWKNAAVATVRLIENGRLDRAEVVRQCLEVLASGMPPRTDSTLAAILESLRLDWSEVSGGQESAAMLVEHCHGSIGTLLLPMAFAATTSASEVRRLVTIAAVRKEAGIKRLAVAGLRTPHVAAMLAAQERAELAGILRVTTDDRALQRQLDELADALPPTRPPVDDRLWEMSPPQELCASPIRALPSPAAADALLDRGLKRTISEPLLATDQDVSLRDRLIRGLWTDGLLRRAMTDPGGAVALLASLQTEGRPPGARQDAIAEALYDAAMATNDPPADYRRALSRVAGGGGSLAVADKSSALTYLVQREALARVGRAPLMLSRPTWDDGTIAFADLVDRLRVTQAAGFGPYDLLQALLRLRVPEPDELNALDGVHVSVDETVALSEHPCRVREGAAAIRLWVVGGGVPALDLSIESILGRAIWVNSASVPISAESFGPLSLDADGYSHVAPAAFVATQPHWGDLYYAGPWLSAGGGIFREPSNFGAGGSIPSLVRSGSVVPGRPMLHELACEMVSTVGDVRLEAARSLVWLVTANRFEPTLFAEVLVERIERACQPLARTVAVLEDAMMLGVMPAVWSVLIHLADRLCTWQNPPTGTVELLRTLVRHVPSVPAPTAPASLRRFAESRGNTKAALEARAYLEAVGPR
jgi:hypothetical protein